MQLIFCFMDTVNSVFSLRKFGNIFKLINCYTFNIGDSNYLFLLTLTVHAIRIFDFFIFTKLLQKFDSFGSEHRINLFSSNFLLETLKPLRGPHTISRSIINQPRYTNIKRGIIKIICISKGQILFTK
jgi:hypothetical protein